MSEKKRLVMIVLEETEGNSFKLYLEGDVERINAKEKDLSAVEIWGQKLFGVCVALMQKTQVIKNMQKKPDRPPAAPPESKG